MMIGTLVVGVLIVLIAVAAYWRYNWGVCTAQTDLTGKTVIITGSNTGEYRINFLNILDIVLCM